MGRRARHRIYFSDGRQKRYCGTIWYSCFQGHLVNLPVPKTHFTKDTSCTAKRWLVYTKNGLLDEREWQMLDVQWKIYHFMDQIPQEQQREILSWVRCFAELVFCQTCSASRNVIVSLCMVNILNRTYLSSKETVNMTLNWLTTMELFLSVFWCHIWVVCYLLIRTSCHIWDCFWYL